MQPLRLLAASHLGLSCQVTAPTIAAEMAQPVFDIYLDALQSTLTASVRQTALHHANSAMQPGCVTKSAVLLLPRLPGVHELQRKGLNEKTTMNGSKVSVSDTCSGCLVASAV